MAFSFNLYVTAGNLTRDPQLKQIGDTTITEFGIAQTDSKKVKGEWKDVTQFWDVTCFGGLAERCAKNLRKGDSVMLHGKIEEDSWEDKNGGGTRTKKKIIANDVRFGIYGKMRDALKAAKQQAESAGGEDAPF